MDRRQFVKTAAAAACLSAAAAVDAKATRRPNVLVLMPDQWRAQSLGCYGNPDVRTPHLDRLAAEGAKLTNVIANSPVCGPARGVILTGTYASTNGLVANDLRLRSDVPSLASAFATSGYRTAFIGKWHMDGGPRNPGFVPEERRHGFQYWAANECSHKPYGNTYFRNTPESITPDKFEPEPWADEAIRFLDSHEQKQPFFLFVSTGAPHDPYIAPGKYRDLYDAQKLTMRANWTSVKGGTREDIAGFYAEATAVDEQMGRILDALERRGLKDNTIVLFTSDHGNMLGSHGKTLKQKPWEESIRVPGLLRIPGRVRASSVNDAVFSHVDFAPTLLALCGITAPAAMQGRNCAKELLGSRSGDSAALLQIFGPAGNEEGGGWRGLRTERYLYARTKDAPWLLYDLSRDPFETKNLVAEPQSAGVVKELDARLKQRMAAIDDHWQIDWNEPIGNGLDRYKAFESVKDYFAFLHARAG